MIFNYLIQGELMAYAKFDKNSMEILVYDDKHQHGHGFPVGEMLFSFLELDLSEYNELYKSLKYDVLRSDFNKLIEKYPKTAKQYQLNPISDDEDYIEKDIREQCDVFLIANEDTFTTLYDHPYFYFSEIDLVGLQAFFTELDFYGFQQAITELIDYCFLDHENPKINELTLPERYYLFTLGKTERWKYNINLHTSPVFIPLAYHADMDIYKSVKQGHFDLENPSDDILSHIKNKAQAPMLNRCESVSDFLYFEFDCLYSNNLKIKRCKNCKKYFVLKGDYSTDYCDRIPEGEKFTCKKIAATRSRKNKVKSNPILKEFEKAYKRNYARQSNHKITQEDFRLWVESAAKERDRILSLYGASPSKQIITDFKEYLGNK